ncbi:hypothetical protein GAY33_02275 [Azospirillum brasilense]|nr:hypothetical protein [Azospirillum argentinense]
MLLRTLRRGAPRWEGASKAFAWVGLDSPLPSGERVARRAGEGVPHSGTSGKSATPSPQTLSPEGRGSFGGGSRATACSPTAFPLLSSQNHG